MSGGHDVYSVDPIQLGTFVEQGGHYVAWLEELDGRLVTLAATAEATFGRSAATPSARTSLRELTAEARLSNGYVSAVKLAFDAGVPAEAALDAFGLQFDGDLSVEDDERLADAVDALGELAALDRMLETARAEGDADAAARLAEQRRGVLLGLVDPELAHTYVYARNFGAMFSSDRVGRDEFQGVASGSERDAILERLADDGITGPEADERYRRMVDAARYFLDDGEAFDRLDGGNDGGVTDGRFSVGDGLAGAMLLSASRSSGGGPSGAATSSEAARELREEVIGGYITGEFGGRPVDRATDLADIHVGDTVLGPLNRTDQQVAVDAFVRGQTERMLRPDPPEMILEHPRSGNDEVDRLLREGYAGQAVRLELVAPVDPRAQAAAALLSGHALWELDAIDQAALVSSLDGDVSLGAGPDGRERTITEAGLFAAALVIPHDVAVPEEVFTYWGTDPAIRAGRLGASTLAGLNDGRAPGADFTAAQSDFVFTLFDQMPDRYGFSHWTENGERYLGHELGMALGVAVHPGDAGAQAFHGERLAEIFMTPEGELLASNNTVIDADTRSQLVNTLLFGRVPNVPDNPHDLAGAPDVVYWDVHDVTDNGSERVIADLAVDNARAQAASVGERLSFSQELHIRQLTGGTGQGRDLAGFSGRVDHGFRNRFVAYLLDNPDWSVEDFSGEGSGFDNPLVNAEVAVELAGWARPGRPLADDEQARVREIGGSDEWIERAGLGTGVGDGNRAAYLTGALEEGWTPATFGLTEDLALNEPINHWLARAHLNRFDDPVMSAELVGLADGDTGTYVEAVLAGPLADGLVGPGGAGLDGGAAIHPAPIHPAPIHPALRGRIDATIEEIDGHRADGAAVNAVPVFLNTGDLQVGTYLFETTNAEGDKVYIDLAGEHFSSVQDWYNHSRLPPGRVVFTGETDGKVSTSEFVSPLAADGGDGAEGGRHQHVSFTTESYVDTFWEKAEPWVVGGVTLVGGVVFFVNPVAGGAILGGVGAYQAGKGAVGLYELHQHGGEFDWSDPRVRSDVLDLGEGVLTAATGAGGAWAGHTARTGGTIGRWTGAGLQGLNATEGVYSVGAVGYQINQILDSDLSGPDKARALARMGFMMTAQGIAPIAIGRGVQQAGVGGYRSPVPPGAVGYDPATTPIPTDASGTPIWVQRGDVPLRDQRLGVDRIDELHPAALAEARSWAMTDEQIAEAMGAGAITAQHFEHVGRGLVTAVDQGFTDLKGLQRQYEGEHDGRSAAMQGLVVDYLTDVERQMLRVEVRDGKLYDADGRLVDTAESSTWDDTVGHAIYVMGPDGHLYISPHQELYQFHHSSILGGQPVAGAGEIIVRDGQITMISRKSGHYLPSEHHRDQVIDHLGELGVDLEPVEVRDF